MHQRKEERRAENGDPPPHRTEDRKEGAAAEKLLKDGGERGVKKKGEGEALHRHGSCERKPEKLGHGSPKEGDPGGRENEKGEEKEREVGTALPYGKREGGRARGGAEKQEEREGERRRHPEAGGDPAAEHPGRHGKGQLKKEKEGQKGHSRLQRYPSSSVISFLYHTPTWQKKQVVAPK